jgi:NAD(P)-dependent dehydrogenase (short-subunit alcohol dehydrogenase family)
MLKNKVIVITGGNGLLGREFCRSVSENNGIAIIADYDEKGQIFSNSLKNSFLLQTRYHK